MDSTCGRPQSPEDDPRLDHFFACFEGLKDPRTGNAGLHDLHELLITALCTVLSGGQGATHMAAFAVAKEPFLRGFLALENGLPSHDTFSRLFRLLDPEQFRAVFQRNMARFSETVQGVVAIDGKVLRRSAATRHSVSYPFFCLPQPFPPRLGSEPRRPPGLREPATLGFGVRQQPKEPSRAGTASWIGSQQRDQASRSNAEDRQRAALQRSPKTPHANQHISTYHVVDSPLTNRAGPKRKWEECSRPRKCVGGSADLAP
jgi:hypothetical protein